MIIGKENAENKYYAELTDKVSFDGITGHFGIIGEARFFDYTSTVGAYCLYAQVHLSGDL